MFAALRGGEITAAWTATAATGCLPKSSCSPIASPR